MSKIPQLTAIQSAPGFSEASVEINARGGARIGRPIRIRTGHSYHVYRTIALGQRNATFVERALTPLARYFSWKWVDSVTFTPEPGFDAVHSWNAVPIMTGRPYIITFEDFCPRTPEDRRIDWLERTLRERLREDRCVALIATSDYALRQMRQQHRDWPGLADLLAKTQVILPTAPVRRADPKAHSDRLKLLFVGRDFMRKGGPVVLRAHERLRALGVPVETTIVSSMGWAPSDYVGPPDRAYVDAELTRMGQSGIFHHRSLPATEVYNLMDAADYLVFPTFHETFGFVSVEALAAGTPVIATETCALPEVVTPGVNGWLLPFENDEHVGKWRWLYRNAEPEYLNAYDQTTRDLSAALSERLTDAWENRREYETLSAGALSAAQTRFNPEIARTTLEEVYERLRETLA